MTEQKQTLQKLEPALTEQVMMKVKSLEEVGGIVLPKDYSAGNAIRAAWFAIQEVTDKSGVPVLKSCTRESIFNAMLKMVTQGLNPAKKQCSFIPYGDKLTMQREYPGTIALARRYGGMEDISPVVIYEGDIFEYAIDNVTGRKKVIKHEQRLENIDESKIKGCYAIITFQNGTTDMEVMTIAQIHKSWEQGQTKGKGPAHLNFPGEMAKKTVIGRACKILISSSDDSILYESESDNRLVRAKAEAEKSASASDETLDITAEEIETLEKEEQPTQTLEQIVNTTMTNPSKQNKKPDF